MASHWGSSWGTAWGSSWTGGVAPVVDETSGNWHGRYRRIDLEKIVAEERERARQLELAEIASVIKAKAPILAPQPRVKIDPVWPFSEPVNEEVERIKTVAAAKARKIQKQMDADDEEAAVLLLMN